VAHFPNQVIDDHDAQLFISVLESCGLQQHGHEPTHVHDHTLDVVINRDTSNLVSYIDVTDRGLANVRNICSDFHREYLTLPGFLRVDFIKQDASNVKDGL